MPEEINRIIADHLATYLIAPDEKAAANLSREGLPVEKIFMLGSTAFDAVARNKQWASGKAVAPLGLEKGEYVLVTIHRTENTENLEILGETFSALNKLSGKTKLVFSLHPRTKKIMEKHNLKLNKNITVIEPQPYLTFLALLQDCRFCMSDSGGIQEEALACNVPCLILRNETEWMRIVDAGKNILVGTAAAGITSSATQLLENKDYLEKIKNIQYDYDGGATKRIYHLIKGILA